MIDGTSTRLREPRDGDLELLGEMRNDLELQALLLARGRPNSVSRVTAWIERVSSAADAVFFVIADLDDEPLGFVQVTAIDGLDGHGQFGIALRESSRGSGHGKEAIELLIPYLRTVLNLRKVVLHVAATNRGAIGLYRATGFREVGTLEQHVLRGDEAIDVLVMERMLAR